MIDLTDTTVLITGAAQGIGLALARAFTDAGARVALTDLDGDRVEGARRGLAATRTAAFTLDVRDRDAFTRVVDAAEDRLGPIGVLCNNAGIGSPESPLTMSHPAWDHVLGVNLDGTVNGVQTVLPRILARGGPGHLVNVASSAGLTASGDVLYSTAKYAVVGMSEALAQRHELIERGIGVTVVCPGFVRTGIMAHSRERRPEAGEAARPELDAEFEATIARAEGILDRYGLDPDVVGAQVLDAVRENRLYVHTDRMLIERIERRTRALLDAMPLETRRDRELIQVLRGLTANAG